MDKKRKAKWQNDYIARAYDRINLTVPKGRKSTIEALASEHNESVTGFINGLLRHAAGMTEKEWKESSENV